MGRILKRAILGLCSLGLAATASAQDMASYKGTHEESAVILEQNSKQETEKKLIEAVKDFYLTFYECLKGNLSKGFLDKKKKKLDALDKLVEDYDFNQVYAVNNTRFFNRHGLYVFTGFEMYGSHKLPVFAMGSDYKYTSETVDFGERKREINRVVLGKTIIPMIDNYITPGSLLSWNNGITVFQEKEVFDDLAGTIYDEWGKYESVNSLTQQGQTANPDWDVKAQMIYDEFSDEYQSTGNRQGFVQEVSPALMELAFIHEASHSIEPEKKGNIEFMPYKRELQFGPSKRYSLADKIRIMNEDSQPHTEASEMIINGFMSYLRNNPDYGVSDIDDLYRLSDKEISYIAGQIE